jgi:hypothetical protein
MVRGMTGTLGATNSELRQLLPGTSSPPTGDGGQTLSAGKQCPHRQGKYALERKSSARWLTRVWNLGKNIPQGNASWYTRFAHKSPPPLSLPPSRDKYQFLPNTFKN